MARFVRQCKTSKITKRTSKKESSTNGSRRQNLCHEKMEAAIMANPQMDEITQKQLSEKFQKEYQAKVFAEIIQKVKNEK